MFFEFAAASNLTTSLASMEGNIERLKSLDAAELSLELQTEGLMAGVSASFEGKVCTPNNHTSAVSGVLCPLSTPAENFIDGTMFFELEEDDIRAIIKPLGLVKKVIRIRRSWLGQTESANVS